MNKIIVISMFLTFGLLSCKTSEKEIDKVEIAKKYYTFLDNSDYSEMVTLLGDNIIIRESDDDYEEKFSKNEYIKWMEWDSVFHPTYKVLKIEQENGFIKAKISKIDKRIFFLHEEPIVSNEVVRFDKNKIIKVEKTYEIFNDKTFLKNRKELLNWIDKNHPKLNGFLHDQTPTGGMKYLKAMELYKFEN